MLERSGPISLTHGQITLIGIAELAGAAGVVLPMAFNIARGSPCGQRPGWR